MNRKLFLKMNRRWSKAFNRRVSNVRVKSNGELAKIDPNRPAEYKSWRDNTKALSVSGDIKV